MKNPVLYKNPPSCDCCEWRWATIYLSATDPNGVLLDSRMLCRECFADFKIPLELGKEGVADA